jgi:hypothetical protein
LELVCGTGNTRSKRRPDHFSVSARESVSLIPGQQLITFHGIWLATERQGPQLQLDAVPVSKIAEHSQHYRAISCAWFRCPQAVNRDLSIRVDNDLDETATVSILPSECVIAPACGGRNCRQLGKKLIHELLPIGATCPIGQRLSEIG